MVLVDTSVWVDFLNGHPSDEAESLTRLIQSDIPIALTGLTLTEVLMGLKNDNQAEKIRALLESFNLASEITPTDYVEAASIYRHCRSAGYTIRSVIDCLIARTAIKQDLWLLAKDRDFQFIAKLFPLKLWQNDLSIH